MLNNNGMYLYKKKNNNQSKKIFYITIIIKIKQKNTLKDIKITAGQFVKEGTGDLYANYELGDYIGKGGFGRVYSVKHKISGQLRAMKIIKCKSNSESHLSSIKKEIEVLKSLDHPNIIKVFEFFTSEKYIFIINELCTGGELFDKIVENKYFTESVACNIMKQILSAIICCHDKGIIHRDLKPENILIESKNEKDKKFFHIKVIDFGTSEIFTKNKLTEQIGTSFYIAPEVLKNSYNEKCDLWSCGVILYILLCGSPPFNGKTEKEIFRKILDCDYTFRHKIWNKVSNEAKNLVGKLLEKNPEKRLSAKEALNDDWFKKFEKVIIDKSCLNNINYNMFIKNITEFYAEQKLQQATLAFLVHNFAPPEELIILKEIFYSFDKNNDGKLSKEEFLLGLDIGRYENMPNYKKSIEGLYKNIDADNNGYIEFEEFVRASINKELIITENNLRIAFNVFDRDKSGGICPNELKYILGDYNLHARDNLWNKMIEQIDLNKDGQISYEEFKKMMMEVVKGKKKLLPLNGRTFPSNINQIDANKFNQKELQQNNATFSDNKNPFINKLKNSSKNKEINNTAEVNNDNNNNDYEIDRKDDVINLIHNFNENVGKIKDGND